MYVLFIHFTDFYDLDDRIELLSKIRTPKLREWGTNYLGQILYFLFYPSSGTAGSMPQPVPIRVCRRGPLRGFNMTTRSKGPVPSSTSNSPSGSDSTSAVAHLMEGPTARMDCL